MPVRTVLHIDAFSSVPNRGNPAGVVLDADDLSDDAMQRIAEAVGFSETAFVRASDKADLRLRFFTPGHEINLCGHGAIASIAALYRQGGLSRDCSVETLAGVLPFRYDGKTGIVTMRQAAPRFREFAGDAGALARALGVREHDFSGDLPIVYGSTGTWTLLVPVLDESALFAMRPDNAAFPGLLTEMPSCSVHPFVLAKAEDDYDFAARHFSSPYSGTAEDPVTGTASGVMGAYAAEHLYPGVPVLDFIVAQGKSVGRDGRVFVRVQAGVDAPEVSIAGESVFIRPLEIEY